MADDLQRFSLDFDKLEEYAKRLANRGERASANDALLLTQLIAAIRANAQRDILLASMAAHLDELDRDFQRDSALHSHAYQSLLGEFRALQRQQDEMRAQLMEQATIIDAGIEKISKAILKIENANENLLESVETLTEP